MRHWILIICSGAVGWAAARAGEVPEVPFWKAKPAVRKKMIEERSVVVSVQKHVREPQGIRFQMQGAGVVAAPQAFSFETAQKYSKLKDISEHFRTVTYDEATQKLFLVVSAMGYQARLLMRMQPEAGEKASEIRWDVIDGHFKGMKGTLRFDDFGLGKTEISLHANYEADTWPLPEILMGFALEVLTQKVAEKMRAFIEDEYKAGSAKVRGAS